MALIVAIVYGLANLLMMAWWGFGGFESLPRFLHSLPASIVLYVAILFVAIYLLLARASAEVRNAARRAVFAPWAAIVILSLKEAGKYPGEFAIILAGAAAVWLIYIPGEYFVNRMTRTSGHSV